MSHQHDLRIFIHAPELFVIDLADAALITLERVLRAEHPNVAREPPPHKDPLRHSARQLLGPARLLRRRLAAYRRAADRHLDDYNRDIPF